MKWKLPLFSLLALLWGCATMPTGPTVQVMPAPGKPFEVFMAEDGLCRQWAERQMEERRRAKRPIRISPPGQLSERCSGRGWAPRSVPPRSHGRRRGNRGRAASLGEPRWQAARPIIPSGSSRDVRHSLPAMHVFQGEPGPRHAPAV